MDAVHLIKSVKDIAKVTLAYAFSGVGDFECEICGVTVVRHGYGSVVGSVFEGIGEKVEKHTFHLF